MRKIFITAVLTIGLVANASANQSYVELVEKMLETSVSQWIHDPLIVNSVKEQNAKHAALTQDEIDSLDKQWRAEKKSGDRPMIDEVLANSLSVFLRKIKDDSNGLLSEVFIMDDKGLNVGQSDVTSDYWQGDEGKWQNTYLVGPDAVFVDEREFDDSSRKFLIQVNIPVVDPETKAPIGAATLGVSLVKLIRMGATQ